MIVHDGFIQYHFPLEPIENVPYHHNNEARHKFHHEHKLNGIPYGVILGTLRDKNSKYIKV